VSFLRSFVFNSQLQRFGERLKTFSLAWMLSQFIINTPWFRCANICLCVCKLTLDCLFRSWTKINPAVHMTPLNDWKHSVSLYVSFSFKAKQVTKIFQQRSLQNRICFLRIYFVNKLLSLLFLQENWGKSRDSITWLKTKKTLAEKQTLALIVWLLIGLFPYCLSF